MSIRNIATRVPRTPVALATRVRGGHVGGVRGVAGTSIPKPDTPPNKGSTVPIAIGAVAVVAGATYFVTRSSKQHGENIVHEAEKKPQVGEPGTTGRPGGAPTTAYKPDGERADGKGRGLAGDITQQEMSSSIKQGLKTDAPKTAYESEEKGKSPAGGKSAV